MLVHQSIKHYLNDCPQRSVVLMHNSERLMGSFCHPARLIAPMLYAEHGQEEFLETGSIYVARN